ncbi:hypothetical protein JCM11641_003331 [Rhodosporidiobolus odoratus]
MEITVRAILLDSDGTLLSTTPAVLRTIGAWCIAQSVDPRQVAAAHHGTRSIDLLRRFMRVPKLGSECTEEELQAEVEKLEGGVVETARKMKEQGKEGIEKLPGVETLLNKLREGGSAWGIVTSATSTHAFPALDVAGIGHSCPEVPFVVTGEMVQKGKPDPAPYLAGLAELRKLIPDLKPEEVLVIEDAPSGLISGKAAGCRVLGVCTGPVKAEEVLEAAKEVEGAVVVKDLSQVEIVSCSSKEVKLRFEPLTQA